MILERTVAPVFAANAYVLAPEAGSEALVVDPGAGSVRGIMALLHADNLRLGAILLTHGHADHVWDAQALIDACAAEGRLGSQAAEVDAVPTVPTYIPAPDRYRLEDPAATTAVTVQGMSFAELTQSEWRCPRDVREVPEQAFSEAVEFLPGVQLRAVPAPGHSEGSSLFFFLAPLADNSLLYEAELRDDPSQADVEETYLTALCGDVIFKGAVGRTDLPGGNTSDMMGTLRFLATAIDPATFLLPGHGAVTTMAHEHRANPYLAEAKVKGGELDL